MVEKSLYSQPFDIIQPTSKMWVGAIVQYNGIPILVISLYRPPEDHHRNHLTLFECAQAVKSFKGPYFVGGISVIPQPLFHNRNLSIRNRS